MKTIREYLEMLNEPERSEAIENTKKDINDESYSNSTNECLLGAFIWEETKQGNSYWYNIYNKLKNNTYKFENENNN